jgi:hypothetical protein
VSPLGVNRTELPKYTKLAHTTDVNLLYWVGDSPDVKSTHNPFW